ncbi:MAG: DUF255 domain-containing protein [Bacteroidetes bacterium]|nr:DUF255 domain-containing protein [Bacteroidota bacterium]
MNSMFILLLSGLMLTGTGPKTGAKDSGGLKWTNFTEGVKEAKATNKKVLIDVYTNWCGWCKKMESDTYSDQKVKDYLVKNFVLVRLNAESDTKEVIDTTEITDAQLASAFRVNGYPTTIFLESNGHPITAAPGYMGPAKFLEVLEYIGGDFYRKMGFDEFLKSKGMSAE